MHLLPTNNEYHSLDIIFLVIFLDFSQFTLDLSENNTANN